MDSKELGIKISADIDDVQTALNELINLLGGIPENVASTIGLNGDEEVQSTIETIKEDLEELSSTPEDISVNLESGDALSEINTIKSDLDELTGKDVNVDVVGDAVSELETISNELDSLAAGVDIPVTVSDGASDTLNQISGEASQTSEGIDGASNSATQFGGILDIVFGAGATAGFMSTINAAGAYEDSWTRLRNAVKEGDKDMPSVMAEWSDSISSMTSITGRGAGDARSYITELGRAGVTNKELLTDMFAGVSEGAFFAKEDVGTFSNQMRMMISQETPRMMTLQRTWGVTDETIKQSFGSVEEFKNRWKTASPEVRAEMLNVLLQQQYLSDGVKDYGDSWQHSLDQAGRSVEYFSRVLGAPILDTAKGVLAGFSTIVSDVASAFTKLPWPVQLAISSFSGLYGVGFLIKTVGERLKGMGVEIIGNPMTRIGEYMLKPAQVAFDGISKLIPDSVKKWIGDLTDFRTKASEIFKGDATKFKVELDDSGLKGKLVEDESRIKSFVDNVRTKIDELKGKFKLSDIFGGDESTTILDTLKTKITTTVDTVKTKWGELKGKLKISEWFGDEKGAVNTDFMGKYIDDIISKITSKLPSLEGVGAKIPEYIGKGITKGLQVLDVLFLPTAIIQAIVDNIWHYEELVTKQNPIEAMFNTWFFGTYNMLPEWIRGLISSLTGNLTSKKIWDALIGETAATDTYNWMVNNIVIPFRDTVNKFLADPLGEIKKINIMELLFGKTKEGEKDPITSFIDDIKDKITGFTNWLKSGIKIPNILDLLMGKRLDDPNADPNDAKTDPVTKLTDGIKNKISEFVGWVKSFKFPNILGLIFGYKEGEDPNDISPIQRAFDKIKQPFQGLVDWINTKISEITSFLSIPWNKLEDGLNEAKQWVFDRWTELKTWVNDRVNEIKAIIPIDWNSIKNGLDTAVQWVKDQWDGLKTFMEGLPDKMYEIGKTIVDRMAEGVRNAIPGLNEALQFVRDHWPASPAKIGPLSTLTTDSVSTYGATLGAAFSDSIKDAMTTSREHFYYGPNGEIQISQMEQQGFDKSKDASNAGTDATRNYPDAITYGQNSGGASWEDSLMSDLQSQLGGSSAGLNDLTQSAGGASAALADVTTNSAHAALGGVDQLGDSSAKAALGWVEATNTVKAALGGISGESNAHPALAAVVSGTPLTGARPALGGVNINVNVSENAVKVDATDTTARAGLGGATGKRIGKGLGQAIADEIGVSVKNQGITITRW